MDEKRVQEVFGDESFVTSLLELETTAEVQTALKEKGIDMTEGEVTTLRDEVMKLAEKVQNGEELTLNQLDEAAGGALAIPVTLVVVAAVATIVSGTATLGVLGGLSIRRW